MSLLERMFRIAVEKKQKGNHMEYTGGTCEGLVAYGDVEFTFNYYIDTAREIDVDPINVYSDSVEIFDEKIKVTKELEAFILSHIDTDYYESIDGFVPEEDHDLKGKDNY